MKRIIEFVIHKPGLALLILLLTFITGLSFKPDFYLVGWDNYSSYFNLPDTIFKTFFSAWREYRGLGVPSDSEVTDIFRQLFYLILSPFVKETLLDQVYIVAAFNAGILLMYFFSYTFIKKIFEKSKWIKYADTFAFFASFFYLFNLSTVSTFYFPMIMFINRFFSIPLLLLIFFTLFTKKKIPIWQYIVFFFLILITSGSYVTATVFITMVMFIIIFSLFQTNYKRFFVVFGFFIAANLFWLLPFANYTVQKSKIIRLAPTFIDANETQLNKSKLFYGLDKQFILYPNFFDTEFKDLTSSQSKSFHPLGDRYNQFPTNIVLFIFPLLYFIGSICILFSKYRKKFLWVPISLFLFLFLSLKEFSPLGFLYAFLDHLTPYFGVLFRFGDTKFHAFIVFPGSIAAAFAVTTFISSGLLSWFTYRKKILITFVTVLVLLNIFVFREYFKGNLIGQYMYNKIPQAYFDVTKDINNDPDSVRVLHLPFDKNGYWKSYSWGMVGSSFLHFMLSKPIFDKTFEPASMENAYTHNRIYDLIANAQSVDDYRTKTDQLYRLLNEMGVKYILYDETISAQLYSRDVSLWGKFNISDTKSMMQHLVDMGYIASIKKYPVNIGDYKHLYPSVFSQTELQDKYFNNPQAQNLILYTLRDYVPQFSFIQKADVVDPHNTNIIESPDYPLTNHFIQNNSASQYTVYPFQRLDSTLAYKPDSISLSASNSMLPKGDYTVDYNNSLKSNNINTLIDIFVRKDTQKMIVSIYRNSTPQINEINNRELLKEISFPLNKLKTYKNEFIPSTSFFSEWNNMGTVQIGDLRMNVGGMIIPLPAEISSNDAYVTSMIVHGDQTDISLLQKYNDKFIDPQTFSLTDNKNCFNDALPDYVYNLGKTPNSIIIQSKNGSTCAFADLKNVLDKKTSHIELKMNISGNTEDLDPNSHPISSKPLLTNYLSTLAKPNTFRICIKEYNIDNCYNTHQQLDAQKSTEVIIPAEKFLSSANDILVLFSVKNVLYQQQEVTITNPSVGLFETIASDSVTIPFVDSFTSKIHVNSNSSLNLIMPRALSLYSFHMIPGKDVLYGSNGLCEKKDSYRTFRSIGNTVVSYFENCHNTLFQTVPFSSNNFSLWSLDYNLASGKFPKYLLDDGFYQYLDDYVSLYQGYPDIKGFKEFQAPEFFASNESIQNSLANAKYQSAYTYVYPHPEYNDNRQKDYTIEQDSENEGMTLIKSFNIQELPNAWSGMAITPQNKRVTYANTPVYSFDKVLPSLWKVSMEGKSGSGYLLKFNEAYDKQWGVYTSLFNAVIGKKAEFSHVDCDGYANCFELHPTNSKQEYYILYAPEKLTFLGWFLTVVTFAGFAIYFATVSRRAV